jgi:hypothetical protein
MHCFMERLSDIPGSCMRMQIKQETLILIAAVDMSQSSLVQPA